MPCSKSWFDNVPWTGVPAGVIGHLVPAAPQPKIALLGGSSKLAKLAEERRKKASASQAAPAAAPAESLSSLDRLSKKDVKENDPPKAEPKKYPIRRKRSPTPPSKESTPPPEEPKEVLPDLRSSPSAFGMTLAKGIDNNHGAQAMAVQDVFGASYSLEPFQGPSPDDTVHKAQEKSKGMNR